MSNIYSNMNKRPGSLSIIRITDILIFFGIDLLALAAAILVAMLIRLYLLPHLWSYYETIKLPPGVFINLWWLPFVAILFMLYEGLYTSRLPYWREFQKIITALSLAYLIVLALVYLLRIYGEVSRTVIIISYFFALFSVPTLRYIARSYLQRFNFWVRNIIIIGTGPVGIAVARAINAEPYLGYKVSGFIGNEHPGRNIVINDNLYPLLGNIDKCLEVIQKENAEIVIIATTEKESDYTMVRLANLLHNKVGSLMLIPDLVGIPVIGIEADYFFNEQLISLRIRNNLDRPEKLLLKRSFDLVAGSALFILFLPLLILAALAVKLDSEGPIIFSQKRIGKGNQAIFNCLKFRTMHKDAEKTLQELLKSSPSIKNEWEKNFKLQRDPRITRIGKVLRSTSIDELPQLINVIRGEMSLVGPRPRPLYELQEQNTEDIFQAGLDVRPGLTGLWQVSGRSDLDFDNRIFLDSWYVRNWSFWLDISILLRTFFVLFRKKGAY